MSLPTRVERRNPQQGPKVVGLPERVALFLGAVHRDRADELLQGFSDRAQVRSGVFLEQLKRWESPQRQARLAHEFGVRRDATERLRTLVVKCEGPLRAALVACLPLPLRVEFPQFAQGQASLPVATRALAARLVREASR